MKDGDSLSERIKKIMKYNKYKFSKGINTKKKNIRNIIYFSKFLILINLFIQILPINKHVLFEFNFSNITLQIKGPGIKNIFCSNRNNFITDYYPNIIYINSNRMPNVSYSYYFNQTNNTVELIWNHNNISNSIYMFEGCNNITEIDMSHFDNSKSTQIYNMFSGCSSLTSINFTNFETSKVIYMGYMFNGCSELVSLDLSSFNTLLIQSMRYVFNGCSSLISLNLSSFKTTSVTWINYMFNGCSSLTSLDLSNFDTSQVIWMNNTFNGCTHLKYINMKNFNEIKLNEGNYVNIFGRVPDNVVICINKTTNKNKILPQIIQKKCYKIYCSDDWNSKQQKKINSVNNCECELDNCLSCPSNDSNKKVCTQCSKGFYQIENDNSNENSYFNCYQTLKGYYLDKNVSLFKKCYYTCETCEIKGDNINHNCLTCNLNYSYEIKINNNTNCYDNYSYYYLIRYVNNYNNINISSYPEKYSELISEINVKTTDISLEIFTTSEIETTSFVIKNIEEIKDKIKDLFNYEKNETKEMNKEEEIKIYDMIVKDIENVFTSENYDTSKLDKGEDQVIKAEKMTITLTTTQNQKNNTDINMTLLDLGECEILLRKYYNISDDEMI